MSKLPLDVKEAGANFGPFFKRLPSSHNPKQASFIFARGALEASRKQRWNVALAYAWDHVTTVHRSHKLHITFDRYTETVQYQQAFYYTTAHEHNEEEVQHHFEVKDNIEYIASQDYFTWQYERDHKEAVESAPKNAADSHIYQAIQTAQAERAWAKLNQGERLSFGALALKNDTIYFEDTMWAHAAHTITYIPPIRPLGSVVFGRETHEIEDKVMVMRDDMATSYIPASQISNMGTLFALYGALYGNRWLSQQPL